MSNGWTPLLEGRLAEQANSALRDIARDVQARIESGALLVTDEPWVALLFEFIDRSDGTTQYADLVDELVTKAADAVAQHRMRPALYGGFVGIAWLMEQFRE